MWFDEWEYDAPPPTAAQLDSEIYSAAAARDRERELAEFSEYPADDWALRPDPCTPWGDTPSDVWAKKAMQEIAPAFVPDTVSCTFQVRSYRDYPVVVAIHVPWHKYYPWHFYYVGPSGVVCEVNTYSANYMQGNPGHVVGQARVNVRTSYKVRFSTSDTIEVNLDLDTAADQIFAALKKHRAPAA